MITDTNKEKAIEILEKILDVFHEKKYQEVYSIVDEVALEGLEEVIECIEEMIAPDAIDQLDKGAEIEFYEFDDESGFSMDCMLTCCGDSIGAVLVIDFAYRDDGIKSILQTIDA